VPAGEVASLVMGLPGDRLGLVVSRTVILAVRTVLLVPQSVRVKVTVVTPRG